MANAFPEAPLISCEDLQRNLHRQEQVILDATFFLPRQQRNSRQAFQLQHIPGAQFFDIDEVADLSSPLPHTLPSAEQFARQVGQMGIDNDSWVIIYDQNQFFASARAWWMFRVFGHQKVCVLDGGMRRWHSLQMPVSSAPIRLKTKQFKAELHPRLIADLPQMRSCQQQADTQILDARSEDSFSGQRPVTDVGLQPGHIPGSINIPYQSLLSEVDHVLLPVAHLRQVLAAAGVSLGKPMVTTCGSGVSAALLLLALYRLGVHDVPMFDGSWAQWGRQAALPKATS